MFKDIKRVGNMGEKTRHYLKRSKRFRGKEKHRNEKYIH